MAGNNAIQFLRGNGSNIAASTQVALAGQPVYAIDTRYLYVGDGSTQIKNLNAIKASEADYADSAGMASQATIATNAQKSTYATKAGVLGPEGGTDVISYSASTLTINPGITGQISIPAVSKISGTAGTVELNVTSVCKLSTTAGLTKGLQISSSGLTAEISGSGVTANGISYNWPSGSSAKIATLNDVPNTKKYLHCINLNQTSSPNIHVFFYLVCLSPSAITSWSTLTSHISNNYGSSVKIPASGYVGNGRSNSDPIYNVGITSDSLHVAFVDFSSGEAKSEEVLSGTIVDKVFPFFSE